MTSSAQPIDIVCFRCGECCRKYQVLLDRPEAEQLSSRLGLSLEQFCTRYADPRWPGADQCLVQQVNGSCPFLCGDNKEFLCTVHTEKPRPCRDWTAALANPECQRGLKKYWQLTVNSAGQLQGAPPDIRAFQRFLDTCAQEERSRDTDLSPEVELFQDPKK